ncbi:Gp138 family membrane-puncturing spike protein [uncultured Anaerococcus sp.]|uniref:Gp138 family membrane-puncturing spike protein n=1 Tax=uncultured Anaerococcus sp. TaxID=293428 RepID=UPI0025DBB571|nr:Gp138 family membrane-puncturing spike protein [uncultured Anaerococcus sp.]
MSDLLRQKKDTNAAFNKFMDSFSQSMAESTVVARIGKVKSYDPKNMSCQVMPLPSKDNSLLINVPVAGMRSKDFVAYYPLKPDDYVVLLFMDGDIDQILLGQDKADTKRGHDISDCIAIGGISLINDELDIEDSESFCLQTMDKKASIVIKANGDIDIKGQSIKVDAPKISISSSNLSINGKATYNGREIARRGDPTTDGASIA